MQIVVMLITFVKNLFKYIYSLYFKQLKHLLPFYGQFRNTKLRPSFSCKMYTTHQEIPKENTHSLFSYEL